MARNYFMHSAPPPESKKQIARLIALGFTLVSIPSIVFAVAWYFLERK